MLRSVSFFHPQGHLVRPGNPFGKDIANAALFRGLVKYGRFSEVSVLNQIGISSENLESTLEVTNETRLISAPLHDTHWPSVHGTLLRGQPYLSELAWIRRSAGLDRLYSLVGLIHTIAPPTVRHQIASTALAPTHSWDALVCTSPAVQKSMNTLFDAQHEYFQERLGSAFSPRPHLPLIPLAVDTERLSLEGANAQSRSEIRSRMGVSDDDFLALWVGRLSYYEKAFPQSMFHALQLATKDTSRRIHFALVGWFPGGDVEVKAYQQAASKLAPDVNVLVLNGNDPQIVSSSWSAADMFISLVDNIQETFGLTPVEAMAAGLPVVVSDWDGYSFTVRHGKDGFLIPTLASPGGPPGELLANLHSLELETYQTYVGATAQHTAVHVPSAAKSIATLANYPELARDMGRAGQLRAQSVFSWQNVSRLYIELFDELAARRDDSDKCLTSDLSLVNPSRGEPFADFQHFATQVLKPDLVLRLPVGVTAADLHDRLTVQLNTLYAGLRGTTDEAKELLQRLEAAGEPGLSVADLCIGWPKQRQPFLETTLVWLAKMDLVDWLPSD